MMLEGKGERTLGAGPAKLGSAHPQLGSGLTRGRALRTPQVPALLT